MRSDADLAFGLIWDPREAGAHSAISVEQG
jgi:hypothetical protein